MDAELKPCPWCTGKPEGVARRGGYYFMTCACLACGPAYDDKQSAIDAWNHRHSGGDGEATGTVADIPDHRLLERAVRWAARKRGRQPAWAKVADVCALGSTYSAQLLRRFGLDPDTGKARAGERG